MPRPSSIKLTKPTFRPRFSMSKKKQKPQPILTDEEFIAMKKEDHRKKKLREQVRNNLKSAQGFGYDYKPVQFDYPQE